MDNIIPSFYKDYGLYVNEFRALPHIFDGLKPIERRVLLSAYEVARNSFVKSVKIDGQCVGNYSPHGSSYGTIVQLVQRGFLYGQGNFGCNVGIKEENAAAPRYTEAMLSPYIKNFFFELIDNVPWEKLELEKEPLYLPTIFPACLIGNNSGIFVQGIGFAFRTTIPCYNVNDLLERLKFLLGLRKEIIIKPISDCQILAKDKEIKTLLKTGKTSIDVKGKYKVDVENFKLHLYSWPPLNKFESILSKLKKELESGDIGFTDLSSEKTDIVFEVLKQRNKQQIFESFVKKLDDAISGAIHFNCVIIDEDRKPRTVSIDKMLLTTYKYYQQSSENYLKEAENKLLSQIEEYKLLEIIKPSLVKHLGKIKDDPKKIIQLIHKDTKIKEDIIDSLLNKYRIKKLLDLNTDITEFNKEIKIIRDNLKDIQKYILTKTDKFMRI
jgi:topoisomerase IV subunit A